MGRPPAVCLPVPCGAGSPPDHAAAVTSSGIVAVRAIVLVISVERVMLAPSPVDMQSAFRRDLNPGKIRDDACRRVP